MAPAAHSGSAIFVELGLALFLKGGSRGLEEGTSQAVRMGPEPSTRWSRKCFRSSVTVEVKFFLGSGHQNNFICSHFRTRSPT